MATTSDERLDLVIRALITFRQEAQIPDGHAAPSLSRKADRIQGRLVGLLNELHPEPAVTLRDIQKVEE